MRTCRWLRAICCLVVLLFLPLIPAGSDALSVDPGPHPMPPHPQRLAEWRAQGVPLPPFLTDPAFFQERGINQSFVRPAALLGPINALAVVVDFNDNVGTVTANFFDSLVFAPAGAGRGSVRDYYDEVSYGQVDIVTVDLPSSLGWVTAPANYTYYTNGNYCWGGYPQNCQKLAEDIVDAVNGVVDFSNYDNDGDGYAEPIMIVHAGPGAEFTNNPWDIWSHSWNLYTPRNYDGVTIDRYVTMPEYWVNVSQYNSDMTIGVFCHEMGHGFWGLPDLYDTDYSSNGVGYWSLMSYGSWNGPNSGGWGSDGSSPAWPEAWDRLVMGFDSYTMVFGPVDNYVFSPVETNQNAITRFKTVALQPLEYFLAENRQRLVGSYDEYLPAGGLLIWHVDEALWSVWGGPDNKNECTTIPHCSGACSGSGHYLVAMEQADGLDDLEFAANAGDGGDPFPGNTNRTFWQPYFVNPGANPESGTWYDNGCASDSCVDLTNIACTPLSNCTASINRSACTEEAADLGDAPASQNSFGLDMTAYAVPYVKANFPTVYLPIANPGPRHHFCQVDAWLGSAVTGEMNADWLPDQDGTTNISPTIDMADMDSVLYPPGYDDGLQLPIPLAHCVDTPVPYTVTVASSGLIFPRYLNVWFDWNRDGDWADTLSCPGGIPAPEWAVQDHVLTLVQGTYFLMTPPFRTNVTVVEGQPYENWMRISLAEMTAPSPHDGRGPASGYDLGETEDYALFLEPSLVKTAELPADPLPGDQVTYQIELGGVGNVIAVGVTVSDVLPAGVAYIASDPPGVYDPVAHTVYWQTDLAPEATQSLELLVEVTGAPSDTITNTAHLLWGGSPWAHDTFAFHVGQPCLPDDPTAAFTWTLPACVGEEVAFTNLSTGTEPISFTWDLDGDGLPDSTAVDPAWQYDAPGIYTVTLTATNVCSRSVYADRVEVLQPLTGVGVAGPVALLVEEVGIYEAVPAPPDATDPLYTWDNGSTGVTTTYSWSDPGLYTIVVTASNDCAQVTGTLDVLVSAECVSLTGVTVEGPTTLLVGEPATYLVTPAPPTATNPAYLWSNGDTGIHAVYTWTAPGTYTVTVTATNCADVVVTGTLSVEVQPCIALSGVSIEGPISLLVGEPATYLATPEPPTATQPAYIWSDGSTDASAVYSWTAPGIYTVAVTATNCADVVVTGSLPVLVSAACISLTGVSVEGPLTLTVGEAGTYLATPAPPTATQPAYLWSNGDTGTHGVYSWTAPGSYTVTVTATNCADVVVAGSLPVVVIAPCIPLTGVSVEGPLTLTVGEAGTYLATPAPPTATQPAYLWSNGSTEASTVYSWTAPGTYTVVVTATNCQEVSVQGQIGVLVERETVIYRIYLPLVARQYSGPGAFLYRVAGGLLRW